MARVNTARLGGVLAVMRRPTSRAFKGFADHIARAHPYHLAAILALIGFALALPSLRLQLEALDDAAQRQMIAEHLMGRASSQPWWDLFNLVDGDMPHGLQATFDWARPWWSWPLLKVHFFRPVAVATMYFDQSVFGDRYWLSHLHSALWYFATCFVVTLLFLKMFEQRGFALLGALLFVVDDAHVVPVGWLACRNILIATTFIVVALLLYMHADTTGRMRWTFAAAILVLLALLSSENVVSAMPSFPLYALLLARRPVRARLVSLFVILATSLAWLWFYRASGYGVSGSGAYTDPIGELPTFWAHLGERFVGYIHVQWGAPMSLHPWLSLRSLLGVDAYCLCVGFPALVIWAILNLHSRSDVRFWLAYTVTGFTFLASAFPHERFLVHVGIGAWALVALLVQDLVKALRVSSWPRQAGAIAFAVVPACSYMLLAPAAVALALASRETPRFVAPVLSTDAGLAFRDLVCVNVPSLINLASIISERFRQHLSLPARSTVLGVTERAVRVTRVDTRTFELFTAEGYLNEPSSTFWRSSSVPTPAGYRIYVRGFEALVTEATSSGKPRRVQFRFDRPLDDPLLRFVYWEDDELRDFVFPQPGQTRTLNPTGR